MADFADDADLTITHALADALERSRRRAAAMPQHQPCGACLNCGEQQLPDGSPWPPAHRWCDDDCRVDHIKRVGG